MITTADYALQLANLDDTIEADVLKSKLWQELEQIDGAKFKGKIHSIEVGRHCEKEIKLLQQMEAMDLLSEELSAKVEAKAKVRQTPRATHRHYRVSCVGDCIHVHVLVNVCMCVHEHGP